MMAASGGDLSLTGRGKTLPPGVRDRLLQIEPPWVTESRRKDAEQWTNLLGRIENLSGAGAAERALDLVRVAERTIGNWFCSWDDLKDFRDIEHRAKIIEYYARQTQNENLEREISVFRCKLKIRLGELLREMFDSKILRRGGWSKYRVNTLTLEKLGISRADSAACQNLARDYAKLSPDQREELFEKIRIGSETAPSKAQEISRKSKGQQTNAELRKRNAGLADADVVANVAVIDPPWPHMKGQEGAKAPTNFPVEKMKKILKLCRKIRDRNIHQDAHIFLWTTNRFLPAAFDILKKLEFKYAFTLVWNKTSSGGSENVGFPTGSFKINTEFVLYARRGNPGALPLRFQTGFSAPFTTGSDGKGGVKPEIFYEMLRQMTPEYTRLDAFNRRKIPGFIGWGNQAGEELAHYLTPNDLEGLRLSPGQVSEEYMRDVGGLGVTFNRSDAPDASKPQRTTTGRATTRTRARLVLTTRQQAPR
jgi:N6-adenosine-specific RNA methylase IME4